MDQQEWQPCILVKPGDWPHHNRPASAHSHCWKFVAGKRIRVIEEDHARSAWRWTCGSERFFLVHPEDALDAFGHDNVEVCEHLILTD